MSAQLENPYHQVFRVKKGGSGYIIIYGLTFLLVALAGCKTSSQYRKDADQVATAIIQEKQKQVLGKTENPSIERPSDILRRHLLIEQNLPYTNQASLGTDKLEAIPHWPEKGYPSATKSAEPILFPRASGTLKITLLQALQIGARNSFEYQQRKEEVFQAALRLDLERNEFRNIFNGGAKLQIEANSSGEDTVSGTEAGAAIGLGRKFKSGVDFSTSLAVDVVNLLTLGGASSMGIVADATISIPLLRGSGEHIVTEPLTQAERDVVYAVWALERFKKILTVDIAREYLEVLRLYSEVENAAENYRNLIAATRRTRGMADAGRVSEIQVDQAYQNELRARNRWVSAEESYKNRMDVFKGSIGLPPDAEIALDRSALEQLVAATEKSLVDASLRETQNAGESIPAADAPIVLVKPGRENAGPLEIDASDAIRLGLKNRLDLKVSEGKVYDFQRKVVVLADALRAELTLFGKARLGESRTLDTAGSDNAKLRTDKGIYTALLTLDLPLERTAERNAYRNSYIGLEQSVRDLQKSEDDIKRAIRRRLREMYEARISRRIQARAQVVAEKRVKSTALFFEAGRIPIRDVLEAQESLINAKNALTSALVDYRVAELEFQRDTGLLQVDEKGLWTEYTPEKGGN